MYKDACGNKNKTFEKKRDENLYVDEHMLKYNRGWLHKSSQRTAWLLLKKYKRTTLISLLDVVVVKVAFGSCETH